MAIILSDKFPALGRSSLPAVNDAEQQQPCPPAHFHTVGKIADYIIVPLNRYIADVTYPDGRNQTFMAETSQTFAIDHDRVQAWVTAEHISGITPENEDVTNTADVFTRRSLAQERVDTMNRMAIRDYLANLHQAELAGATIERRQINVSDDYEGLAVRKKESPARVLTNVLN